MIRLNKPTFFPIGISLPWIGILISLAPYYHELKIKRCIMVVGKILFVSFMFTIGRRKNAK